MNASKLESVLEVALSISLVVTRLLVEVPRVPPKACVESLLEAAEEATPGCFAWQFQMI